MPKRKVYDLYLISDKVFDQLLIDGTSGIDFNAITQELLDGSSYSVFRSSYWPKRFKKDCTVQVRTLFNGVDNDMCYNVILHEVGHAMGYDHSDKNTVMVDRSSKDHLISIEDRVSILKEILSTYTHFKIHLDRLPI